MKNVDKRRNSEIQKNSINLNQNQVKNSSKERIIISNDSSIKIVQSSDLDDFPFSMTRRSQEEQEG
jgi:hypothetical protein